MPSTSAVAAGARRLVLTHHDSGRSDDEVDAIAEAARERVLSSGGTLEVGAAAEGDVIELGSGAGAAPGAEAPARSAPTAARPATQPVETALADRQVVVCGLRGQAESVVCAAATAETLPLRRQPGFGRAVLEELADNSSTVVIDAALAAEHADAILLAQRGAAAAVGGPATLVVVTSGAGSEVGDTLDHIVAERLVWPFTEHYARARIRAAVLRAGCRWQVARLPADEAERLDELRGLAILDTPREERFDRIVRIAARAMRAPAALITLIDAERQWFKSCVGLDGDETSREVAFCAHAILQPEPLVVTDTFGDARFADNPMVTDGPRIRFYAGCQIRSPGGQPLGTLCVVDWQPREVACGEIEMLRELAGLVEEELAGGRRAPP